MQFRLRPNLANKPDCAGIVIWHYIQQTKIVSCTTYIFIAGCGVFATKEFSASDFLLEFRGKLISAKDGEKCLSKGDGSFLYFFEDVGRQKMW